MSVFSYGVTIEFLRCKFVKQQSYPIPLSPGLVYEINVPGGILKFRPISKDDIRIIESSHAISPFVTLRPEEVGLTEEELSRLSPLLEAAGWERKEYDDD